MQNRYIPGIGTPVETKEEEYNPPNVFTMILKGIEALLRREESRDTFLIEGAGYIRIVDPAPQNTQSGTDTQLQFARSVNRVIMQNNTAANAWFAFDNSAGPGSLVLLPGTLMIYPKRAISIHLWTAAAQPINGGNPANIVVLGAM